MMTTPSTPRLQFRGITKCYATLVANDRIDLCVTGKARRCW